MCLCATSFLCVPTDAYPLEEAVTGGYLVPARAVSVPLKFPREGIRYDDLSEEEKDEWDAREWDEDGDVPDLVASDAVNKWLFNADTVDKRRDFGHRRASQTGSPCAAALDRSRPQERPSRRVVGRNRCMVGARAADRGDRRGDRSPAGGHRTPR